MVEGEGISIVRACAIVCLSRSMWYYTSQRDDRELLDALRALFETQPQRGIDYYYHRLRRAGYPWNRKRVLRVYRLMGLSMRRRARKRLPKRIKRPLEQPERPNQVWSADFMSDSLCSGRRFRVFNLMDDFHRASLCNHAALSMPADRVVECITRAIEVNGRPEAVRVDNGPEFLSHRFTSFCREEGIAIRYIQPGSPSQNGYMERLNRTFREDVLDAHLFEDIEQVNEISKDWREEYNRHHPHKSLGRMAPKEFLENHLAGLAPPSEQNCLI